MESLQEKSFRLRRMALDMVYRAKTGHIGGDFSVMDILIELYCEQMNVTPQNQGDPARDRLILSKGHAVEALYAVLSDRGFLAPQELVSYAQFGSRLLGHPSNKVPGIEQNTGSLGHGLPLAVGMALAGKMQGADYRTYVVMGDGELAEGSVWEGAMAAGNYHLDNLCAVIDRNRLQISGCTEDVMRLDPLDRRFEAFGWNVITVDGHNFDALRAAFTLAKSTKGKPTVLIAQTVKGYGVSFAENQAAWHHRVPNEQEYIDAVNELTKRMVAIK